MKTIFSYLYILLVTMYCNQILPTDMIYAQLHIRLLHTTYTSFVDSDKNFLCMDPRGVVVRIYKEDYYTMLHKNNIKLYALRI